jgi:hypothetical protein
MLSAENMQEMMSKTLSRVTSRKTFLYNSRKTLLHNSRKTFLYNSRKILLNQSRNNSHAMRKISLDQLRNNSRSTRKLSLDQSKNNSHLMRKLFLDQVMRKLLLDQAMRKLFLDQLMRKLFLNHSSNNSRSWRKSSLIFSNESFFQFEDILFESLNDANSLTTREDILESSSKKIIFDHAFFVRFSSRMQLMHINLKEMQAMLWALKTWIHIFMKKKVTLYCDNQAVINDIRKLFIRDSTMKSLWVIVTLLTLHDVLMKTVWISSKKNVLADQLSRAKWE